MQGATPFGLAAQVARAHARAAAQSPGSPCVPSCSGVSHPPSSPNPAWTSGQSQAGPGPSQTPA